MNQLLNLTLEQAESGEDAEHAAAKQANSLLGKLGAFASMKKKGPAKVALAK